MQYFKGDDLEKKFFQITEAALDTLDLGKDQFFTEAYSCFLLGDVLYNTGSSVISGAMSKDVFRQYFFAIFDSFINGGSLESYMTVFRAIFGDNVDVVFSVPAPGHLIINIDALDIVLEPIYARRIVDEEYVYSQIVDQSSAPIEAQLAVGIKTQEEIDKIMYELCPGGIFVETNLVFS